MTDSPGGYYGGGQYLISPAYAVTPFVTIAGLLIGNDVVAILPASIYPRKLLGINLSGPASATAFEVYLGSPSNLIDSSNVVSSNRLQYNTPFDVPPGTQVFCYWRNAASVTAVPATVAEVVGAVTLGLTASVATAVGTGVGDTLFCWHHDNFLNTNGETVNMTAPSGTLGTGSWVPIINTNNGAGACGGRLWMATTVATGAHTVQTNQLDGASSNALIVARIQAMSFYAASASQLKNPGATGPTIIAPDISGGVTQQAQDTLFRLFAINSGAGAPVPAMAVPAGYTLRKENVRNTSTDQALFSQLMTTGAASIGAVTTSNTQSTADAYETISLLVRGIPSTTSVAGQVTFQMSA
jgi:hypothetical protein